MLRVSLHRRKIMVEDKYIIKRSGIKITETDEFGVPAVALTGVKDFSVEKTFDCGQCFRFNKCEDERFDYAVKGVANGRLVEIGEKDGILYILGSNEEDYKRIWRSYLGLDVNYTRLCEDVNRECTAYSVVGRAYGCSRGIRILSQEHWETLCSFIISQNNNIPRIKLIIERLSKLCGEKFTGFDGEEYYTFPTPEAVAKEGEYFLREIGTGFRAKYIVDAAERVITGRTDFSYLEDSENTAECVRHLSEIYGVGEKVASCTLLFSFGKFDAFPKDVWIKRVIDTHFPEGFEAERLGKYRGIVQQWLFYGSRWVEI